MLRCILIFLLACLSLAAPARAKDELVIGMNQYPGTWHPYFDAMLARSLIENMSTRPTTAYDPDWNLACLLCVELPTVDNGRARVVDLPPDDKGGVKKGMSVDWTLPAGVKWGDGTPVTTKDVAFSIEVGKHPQSGVAAAEGFRRILKVDIKDERNYTLLTDRVTFDYNADALKLLPAHIERPIFEASPVEYRKKTKYDSDTTNAGLYYGPYRPVEIVPGSRIVLEQNPHWYGKKPYFKRIVFKFIENSAALEANLLSGNVDYVIGELGLTLDQALAFEKRHKDRFNVVYKPALIYEHIDTNLDNPLLADLRVRQALLLSIDREAVSQKLFEGKQPVAHGEVSPLDKMYSPGVRQYAYDPAAARKLLDEAGFSEIKNGVRQNAKGERLSLELTTTAGNRVREQVAQVLQSQWRQAGIDVRLKPEPPRIFSESLNRRKFTGLAMYAWVTRPEGVPQTTLHSTSIPTEANNWAGQNYPAYKNPEMDRTLDAMEQELDPTKRRALFAEFQRLYADDLPVLPLYFRSDAFVLPKQLKGVRPTGHLNSSTLWVEDWRWED